MKKSIVMLVFLFLALLISGCGEAEVEDENTKVEPEEINEGTEANKENEEEKEYKDTQAQVPDPEQKIKEDEETATESPKEEIKKVLWGHLEAAKAGDLDRFLDNLHPDYPYYEEEKANFEYQTENYDMEYELEIIEINQIDEDTVEVNFRQVNRAEGYDDNEITGFQELSLHNDKWKISDTAIEHLEPLD